jgi:hypothetical protein
LQLLERRRAVLVDRLADAQAPVNTRATRRAPDRYLTSLMEHRTRSTERDLEWVDELIAAEQSAAREPATDSLDVA